LLSLELSLNPAVGELAKEEVLAWRAPGMVLLESRGDWVPGLMNHRRARLKA